MTSQTHYLKERLEAIANNPTIHRIKEVKAARELLKEFPEEDTEEVKAYRALVTLQEYLDSADLDTGYHVDDYEIQEQLFRLRGQIEGKAVDDIEDRLEEDEHESPGEVDATDRVLYDPISKMRLHISGFDHPDEARYAYFARDILEAPL